MVLSGDLSGQINVTCNRLGSVRADDRRASCQGVTNGLRHGRIRCTLVFIYIFSLHSKTFIMIVKGLNRLLFNIAFESIQLNQAKITLI